MIKLILLSYVAIFILWILYLAVMNLKDNLEEMSPIAKAHAYPIIILAVVFDVAVNLVIGTILFLDPPREWMLTARLKRYVYGRPGRREAIASWICFHLLNQFDPSKKHC